MVFLRRMKDEQIWQKLNSTGPIALLKIWGAKGSVESWYVYWFASLICSICSMLKLNPIQIYVVDVHKSGKLNSWYQANIAII